MGHGAPIRPVADPSSSYWLHELDADRVLGPEYAATDSAPLPAEADVVIVGAGITGISVAYHLSRLTDLRIVVLDSRGVSEGATGRNGGLLWPFLDPEWKAFKEKYGLDEAKRAVELEHRNIEAILTFVRENPGSRATASKYPDGGIVPFNTEAELDRAARELKDRSSDGVGGGVEVLNREALKAYLGPNHKYAGAYRCPNVWRFSPAAFVVDVAKQCLERGVRILKRVTVEGVEQAPSGKLAVKTSRGSLLSSHVVYATNGWTRGLVDVPITPVRNQVLMSTPDCGGHRLGFALSAEEGYVYITPRADGRVLIGGCRHIVPGMEAGVTSDREADHEPAVAPALSSYLRTLPEMEAAEFDFSWSGILGFTPDYFPLVGAVPGKKNQWIAAGYSGHGMPRAFLAGRSIAHAIAGNSAAAKEDTCAAFDPARFANQLKD
ncbi:FAD dependent oxidoreductase [Hyaloraphidium curvatum]|nr:FAD dependent oxidoreductase [Hyaloraphidium curvatum]